MGPDPVRGDEAAQRDEEDEVDVEPVDVLVPVLQRHGLLADVRLANIVSLASHGLEVGGPIREGLGLLHRGGRGRHGGQRGLRTSKLGEADSKDCKSLSEMSLPCPFSVEGLVEGGGRSGRCLCMGGREDRREEDWMGARMIYMK